jgi:septum site-determining protein MinD
MVTMISIHSYRGGTGKSNTTANLATVIAREGKRVGIIDTDLPSPGIHVLFGLQQEQMRNTLNNFLWGDCSITEAAHDVTGILEGQATNKSKIYLVPSSPKLNDISRMLREKYDVEQLFDGFQDLSIQLNLDYLFIDTHPGLNEETLLSLTLSDIVLIVLRPDQQDFQGTAVNVDIARKLQVPNLLLMVNKALTDYDLEKLRQQVEKTYNTPTVGVIPESTDLIRLGSNGIFSLKYPNHPITKVIESIAQKIIRIDN